jgi:putative ABC transport system ATP-binding protein
MLHLAGVWRRYQAGESEVVALADVNLDVGPGEFVAIIGPSGSGKSTLLQIIGLVDRPTEGLVELDGEDVLAATDGERSRLRLHRIGFVFQRFHLLHDLTAIENVALPMEAAGAGLRERYDRAAELLGSVGLADRLTFRPAQLSGGQRQRVAMARALANHPPLILADEPTGELHSDDKARVIQLLQQFHDEGHTIVVVTHDQAVAAAAERRLEMRDGRMRELT